MIVDTSAIIAIVLDEPRSDELVELLLDVGEPLLFVGDDFIHTDVTAAYPT